MTHRTAPSFWHFYGMLPADIKRLADENFKLLKADPRHPSLHFKKVKKYWTVRAGIHYRAVAQEVDGDMVWFWIGHHSQYDPMVKRI